MVIFLFSCNKDDVIDIDVSGKPVEPGYHEPTPQSSQWINKVFEWTPAPGQYINDFDNEFFNDSEISQVEAANMAFKRLQNHSFVSLGAFGGYIVVGFDHSVKNVGGYEIGVIGNAFLSGNGNSNEPGIVYVMKDENQNGLPDDTWYELKGSDTFSESTIRNYKVTYYRPDKEGQPVKWVDNLGNSGEVDYLGTFHKQPTYYPSWIVSDSYTLSGTCLKSQTFKNPETGNWDNPPFKWGYADNIGEDNINFEGFNNCNRFSISNAINSDFEPISLDYIDFVKIQTGVSDKAGMLGEVSTEILGVIDLSL